MNAPATATISHDALAALLQLTREQLQKLVSAGVIGRAGPGKYVPAQAIREYITHLHQDPERRERSPTQVEIAEHLDMSERNLREVLVQVGLGSRSATLAEIRIAYIRRLREQSAGRDDKLANERAALARSQRMGQDIKNAIAQREYAPIGLLTDVLAAASAAVNDRFEALRGDLRKRCPDLSETALATIDAMLADARSEWARSSASLAMRVVVELTDDDDEPLDPLDDDDDQAAP